VSPSRSNNDLVEAPVAFKEGNWGAGESNWKIPGERPSTESAQSTITMSATAGRQHKGEDRGTPKGSLIQERKAECMLSLRGGAVTELFF